jgi:hypothetical protein
LNRTGWKNDHDTFNGIKNGWRQNLRSAGDITPAIKYSKAVIPAKAGIQENTLDAPGLLHAGAGLSSPA